MLDLTTIDNRLDALQAALPRLLQDYPEQCEFWNAFAGETEVIEEQAGDHAEHVYARLRDMLRSANLLPASQPDVVATS